MCPIYMVTREEKDCTRGRSRLVVRLFAGIGAELDQQPAAAFGQQIRVSLLVIFFLLDVVIDQALVDSFAADGAGRDDFGNVVARRVNIWIAKIHVP